MLTQITRALLQAKRYPALVKHVHAHGEAALPEGWRELIADAQWRTVVTAAAYINNPNPLCNVVRCLRVTGTDRTTWRQALLPEWRAWYDRAGLTPPDGSPDWQGWRLDVPLAAVLAA